MTWWRDVPDDTLHTLTGAQLKRLAEDIRCASEHAPEYVSTVQASRILGRSASYWRELADAGAIAGAFQEEERGPWTLPLEACREHLGRLARTKTPRGSIRRDPWKAAS